MDSKLSMPDQISSEKSQNILYVQKKTLDPCKLTILWNFFKACEELIWNHEWSTPHGSETRGIAEWVVGRVKQEISSALFQFGLQESWRAEATKCHCQLRNMQDLFAGGQTPYERRSNSPFDEPIIPFGAEVKFYPKSSKTKVGCISSVQSPSQKVHWINFERGGRVDWWSFGSGYRGYGINSSIWNSRERFLN